MRVVILIVGTTGICLFAIFAYLSVESSKEVSRERAKQEAIRRFDEEQAQEEAQEQAKQLAWRREHPVEQVEAKTTQWHEPEPIGEDAEIANLKSADHDILNTAIHRLYYHRVCRAVPDLMGIVQNSSDDYIAGIAAQAVVRCQQPSTYPVVVEQFLNRPATPALIAAIGETGTQDDRVYRKLHLLLNEPNSDRLVPDFARHAIQQIDIQTQSAAQQR